MKGLWQTSRREVFMDQVRKRHLQANKFPFPADLDPIRFRFDLIDPREHAINHQAVDTWDVFIPQPLVANLRRIFRDSNDFSKPIEIDKNKEIDVYCFYGNTGLSGSSPDNGGMYSLMGIVLHQNMPDNKDRIHIVFRGSRSGSPFRYLVKNRGKKGNADWVTDLQFLDNKQYKEICKNPLVNTSVGFSKSLKTIFPSLKSVLNRIDSQMSDNPGEIYLAGHSLGGAYALLFGTSMLFGDIRDDFPNWNWKDQKVITYGAPACGNAAHQFLVNSSINFRRIYINGDPIVTPTGIPREKVYDLQHSGLEILLDYIGDDLNHAYNTDRHEFIQIRKSLVKELFKFDQLGPDVPGVNYNPDNTVSDYDELFHSFYQKKTTIDEILNTQNISTTIYNTNNFPSDYIKDYLSCLAFTVANKSSYFNNKDNSELIKRRDEILGLAVPPHQNDWNIDFSSQLKWTDEYFQKTFGIITEWRNKIN
ncbi:MAG: lipase family protein [Saprospiraceae bacterium]|nr:lipase family protein [Saprospiraceae bacterium]